MKLEKLKLHQWEIMTESENRLVAILAQDTSSPENIFEYGRVLTVAPELLQACKLALTGPYGTYVQVLRDVIAKAENAYNAK